MDFGTVPKELYTYHGHSDRKGKNEYLGVKEDVSKNIINNLKKIGVYDKERDLYKIDIKELKNVLIIYGDKEGYIEFHYFTNTGSSYLESEEGFEILVGYLQQDYQYLEENFS
jgi:hypothetical protein